MELAGPLRAKLKGAESSFNACCECGSWRLRCRACGVATGKAEKSGLVRVSLTPRQTLAMIVVQAAADPSVTYEGGITQEWCQGIMKNGHCCRRSCDS